MDTDPNGTHFRSGPGGVWRCESAVGPSPLHNRPLKPGTRIGGRSPGGQIRHHPSSRCGDHMHVQLAPETAHLIQLSGTRLTFSQLLLTEPHSAAESTCSCSTFNFEQVDLCVKYVLHQ